MAKSNNTVVNAAENVAANAQPFLVPGDRVKWKIMGASGEGTVVEDLGDIRGHRMIRVKWDREGLKDSYWEDILPVRGKCRFYRNAAVSSNAVVNAALAWKDRAAKNGKFKVGDYVLYEGHGEGYHRGRIVSLGGTLGSAGCVVEWVGGGRDSVPYTRLTHCNSAAPDSSVAANAGVREGNYQVTIETVDFSGNRTQSKNLTASQLKTWLSLIHCDGSDSFLDEIASSSRREVHFNLDMHPTIRIKAM